MNEMDRALCRHYGVLLGLEKPWSVAEVRVDPGGLKVELRLEHDPGARCQCPECGKSAARHDWAPERRWRHLDVMQFETVLVARAPRVDCPACGVKTAAVPWAGKHSRFTLLFEHFAILVMQACANQARAAALLGVDWWSLEHIVRRAVERGLERRSLEELARVGIDEKSFGRGQNYVSILSDLEGARVLEVVEGNDTDAAVALWRSLPEKSRKRVEAVAMDMSAAFEAATVQEAPDAQIVHDRFHVAKLLGEAVDKVRRQEAKVLSKRGDDRLKGTRHLWLYSAPRVPDDRVEEFAPLAHSNLRTARAWAHKENLAPFWEQADAEGAERYFRRWYASAIRSRLEPIKKVARTLRDHLANILTYFTHRITNALAEGINSRVQAIKAHACGFRCVHRFRIRILFHLGKLDMSPLTP